MITPTTQPFPSSPLTAYVAGFMFSVTKSHVALIRKSKPAWQKGLLNGIGGKIEASERPEDAMTREFREETGLQTHKSEWRHFLTMTGARDGFSVDFFASVRALTHLCSMEEEKIEIVPLREIHPLRTDMIENLPWLISLALDHVNDGRPAFVTVVYDDQPAAVAEPNCCSIELNQQRDAKGWFCEECGKPVV